MSMIIKNCSILILAIASILQSSTGACAQEFSTAISSKTLAVMAHAAVLDEVASFNQGLTHGSDLDGYRSRMINYFQRNGKNSIDPAYVSEKCIFSEDNLSSLFSDQLSSGDDALALRKNVLLGVKSMYGAKIWKLVSEVCSNARERFVDRLSNATRNSVRITLSDDDIDGIARLIFYPTDHGRPSFKKSIDSAFNVILSGSMMVGATGALIGIPAGGVVLVVVTLTMGARNTASLIAGQRHPFLTQLRQDNAGDLIEAQIDLNPTELTLIAGNAHP